jgi:hypothetical protein
VAAEAALDSCLLDGERSCAPEHRRLRAARDAHLQAVVALRRLDEALTRFLSAREQRRVAVDRLVSAGGQVLDRWVAGARDYAALGAVAVATVAGSAPRAALPSAVAGRAGPGSAVPAADPGRGLPPGFAMVPLSAIDAAADPVRGRADFTKGYSPEDLAWAFDALEDVVLPLVAAGTPDLLGARDAASGLVGTRSYAMTRAGFLGGDAIVLDDLGNGRYAIVNGRHRIWVAQQTGRSHVPARLTGRGTR